MRLDFLSISRVRNLVLFLSIPASALAFHLEYEHGFGTPKILALLPMAGLLLMVEKRRAGITFCEGLLVVWPVIFFWPVLHLGHWLHGLLLTAFYGLTLLVSPNEKDREFLRRGLAVSSIPVVLYLLVQKAGLDPISFHEGQEAGGFLGNTNFSAHYLLLCLCLGQFGKKHWRYAGYAFILVGLLLCRSRAAWCAALVFFCYHSGGTFRLARPFIYSLAVVLVLGLGFVFRTDIREGFDHITHMSQYEASFQEQPRPNPDPSAADLREPWFKGKRFSLMTRYMLMGNSCAAAMDSAFMGVGMGQFHITYPRYSRAILPDVNMNEVYRASSAHNLILDSIIQLGLPWLAVLIYYLTGVWCQSKPQYRLALGLQLGVAMVSLNYLNPLIVGVFILLRPGRGVQEGKAVFPVVGWLLAALILCLSWLDLKTGSPQWTWPELLFPDRLARQAYDRGDMDEAWVWQIKALDQDPYGPETLFNLGLIALEREGAHGKELAVDAFRLIHQMHPHYLPAKEQLDALIEQSLQGGPFLSHEDFLVKIRR